MLFWRVNEDPTRRCRNLQPSLWRDPAQRLWNRSCLPWCCLAGSWIWWLWRADFVFLCSCESTLSWSGTPATFDPCDPNRPRFIHTRTSMQVKTVKIASVSDAKVRATALPELGAGNATANMKTNLMELQFPKGRLWLMVHIAIVSTMERYPKTGHEQEYKVMQENLVPCRVAAIFITASLPLDREYEARARNIPRFANQTSCDTKTTTSASQSKWELARSDYTEPNLLCHRENWDFRLLIESRRPQLSQSYEMAYEYGMSQATCTLSYLVATNVQSALSVSSCDLFINNTAAVGWIVSDGRLLHVQT